MILDQNYISLKSQVIKAERRVLKELGFCVHVKHPHKLIVMYLKFLDFDNHQEMMQIAWNFMNDSFRTDVFVRYQPETIGEDLKTSLLSFIEFLSLFFQHVLVYI